MSQGAASDFDRRGHGAVVAGASGFGRLHARELARLGYAPIYVAGRSARSAEAAARALRAAHEIDVRAAADFDAALAHRPAVVTVCVPPELHLEFLAAAARSDAYVLCEKPFFWDPTLRADAAFAKARAVFDLFAGRLLVNHLNAALGAAFAGTFARPPAEFRFAFATSRASAGREIGIDLLPHAVSATLAALGPAEPRAIIREEGADRFDVAFEWGATRCRFELRRREGASEMEMEADGVVARRQQVAVGNTMEVWLALADGRRVPLPNPLSAMFDRLDRAARARGSLDGDRESTCNVVRWCYVFAGLE